MSLARNAHTAGPASVRARTGTAGADSTAGLSEEAAILSLLRFVAEARGIPVLISFLVLFSCFFVLAATQVQAQIVPPTTVDYDSDDDGLIEITALAQFDAVRHDLDGDGTPTDEGMAAYSAAFPDAVQGMGCSTPEGCAGYELMADLDFNTDESGDADDGDAYWNNGAGWAPIGGDGSVVSADSYTERNPFLATFEGNGHTVANLFIDTLERFAGLFGYTGLDSDSGAAGVIRNVGLIDVNVSGELDVGGLVGQNRGVITGSYVTGCVSGWAYIGGLVGNNYGTITSSYAAGRVSGDGQGVGGLVGVNNGDVTASYWDTRTSGHPTGTHGEGRTTTALQAPTDYSGIYRTWNLDLDGLAGTYQTGNLAPDGDGIADDPWAFGTAAQYPVLAVDVDGNGQATWQEFGYQLRAGPALMAEAAFESPQAALTWTAPEVSYWVPAPGATYTVLRDDGATVEAIAENLAELNYTDTEVTFGETYTYQVAAVVDGGEATRSAQVPVTVMLVDTTSPTVSSIAISSNPGTDRTYAAGDEIRVTVTFSETVEVMGAPRLQLELGGGLRTADYRGGTGTAALVFAYEVDEGDSDTNGVGIQADSLTRGGGTIRDGSDNDAVLDHEGLAADAGHQVDGVRPELAAIGGAVVNGTTLTLTYNEALDPSSAPLADVFTVTGGNETRTVTRVRVSGSAVMLTLDPAAEHGETGMLVSYTVPTGTGASPIRDVAGNEAEALSRVPVTNETPDTTPPAVSRLAIGSNPGADQTYAAEDVIEVTVSFSETVEVEGTPRLRLRVGSRSRTAGYRRGSGAAALVFGYEVAVGDEDTDGVSIEAGRITLNGGSITDEAGNPVELAHEALPAQAGHQVDGVRPAFLSAAVEGASLTLTYGETLDPGSRPAAGDFTVEVGGDGRSVSGVSISGSVVALTLDPAVEHGDTGIRVSYTVPTGAGANPLRDAAGNEAEGLSNEAVTNTTGAPNTAPVITSVGPFEVPENQALVRRLAARDEYPGDELMGWSIVGGADGGRFSVASGRRRTTSRRPTWRAAIR